MNFTFLTLTSKEPIYLNKVGRKKKKVAWKNRAFSGCQTVSIVPLWALQIYVFANVINVTRTSTQHNYFVNWTQTPLTYELVSKFSTLKKKNKKSSKRTVSRVPCSTGTTRATLRTEHASIGRVVSEWNDCWALSGAGNFSYQFNCECSKFVFIFW